MCIKAYYGWECGHADLSATELLIEPCGPPERYPHEPFCSPVERVLVPRKVPEYDEEDEDDVNAPWANWQTDVCQACYEIITRMNEKWSAKKTKLRGKVSEKDLESIDAQLREHRISVFEKGHISGPDHTVHRDEYERGQQAVLQDMGHLLKELWDAKDYFQDQIRQIASKRMLPKNLIREYQGRYARADRRRTALNMVQIKRFRALVTQYIADLSMRYRAAVAAHEPLVENPLSGVAELFAETEPKGGAEPSDK